MNRLWHDAAWCHIVKWQGRLWPRAQAFRCVFSESVLQRTFAYQPKRQWQTLSMSICQLSTEKITLIECTGCRAVHIFLPSPAKQVGNFEFQTNDKTEKHWTLSSVTSLFWIGVPRIYSKNIFKFIWRSLFYNNSHTNITFYAIFAFPQWWKNGCWSLMRQRVFHQSSRSWHLQTESHTWEVWNLVKKGDIGEYPHKHLKNHVWIKFVFAKKKEFFIFV